MSELSNYIRVGCNKEHRVSGEKAYERIKKVIIGLIVVLKGII